MSKSPRIAVIGAGLGGAATASLLLQEGFDVRVYEQAPSFSRLGAGIHVGPNVMKILRRIGIEDALNAQGSHPDYWYSRHGMTGDVLAQIPLGDYAVKTYGASYLTVHRGDFHALLIEALPERVVVEKNVAKRVAKSHKIRTDTGIDIAFPAEYGENPDFIEFVSGPNGLINIELKNIGHIENR